MPKEYPVEILPQSGFLTRMNISVLLKKYPALVAVRTCNVPTENAYVPWEEDENKTKVLSDEAIGNCEGLSMNLLGGCFDKDKHSRFRPLAKRAREDWKEGEVLPVTEEDYQVLEKGRLLFYFYVRQWMGLPFPYYCGFTSQTDYEKAKSDAEKYAIEKDLGLEGDVIDVFTGKGKPVRTMAVAEVNHHPTPLNYWHVQMDCRRMGQSPQEATRSDLRKIAYVLKEILIRNIVTNGKICYHIHPRHYKQCPTILEHVYGSMCDFIDRLRGGNGEKFMQTLSPIKVMTLTD